LQLNNNNWTRQWKKREENETAEIRRQIGQLSFTNRALNIMGPEQAIKCNLPHCEWFKGGNRPK
jgi:hypothetical protein